MNTWNYVCGMLMYYISEFALNVLMWEFLFQGYRWWFADTCPFRDPVGCFFGFEVTTGVSPMPSILHTVSGKVSYVGDQLCLLNWPTKYVNIFVRWKLLGDDLLAHLFYFIFLVYMQRSRRISFTWGLWELPRSSNGHAWICIIYGTQKSIVGSWCSRKSLFPSPCILDSSTF